MFLRKLLSSLNAKVKKTAVGVHYTFNCFGKHIGNAQLFYFDTFFRIRNAVGEDHFSQS